MCKNNLYNLNYVRLSYEYYSIIAIKTIFISYIY